MDIRICGCGSMWVSGLRGLVLDMGRAYRFWISRCEIWGFEVYKLYMGLRNWNVRTSVATLNSSDRVFEFRMVGLCFVDLALLVWSL